MEDMRRLAFCSTKCCYDVEDTGETVGYLTIKKYFRVLSYNPTKFNYKWQAPLKRCIANSKNFPDTDVSELVDSLKSGFGIRFLYDEKSNYMDCVYVRDILKDTTVISINTVEIHEVAKLENGIKGFRLKYSGAGDDTNYNYKEWGKDVVLSDDYNYIISKTDANNKNLYIDTRNGDSYRIKIDEEATSSEEKNPALIEVGAYNPATYGDCNNEGSTETVEIGFTPVTMNDVYYKKRRTVIRSAQRSSTRATSTNDSSTNDQMFAYFLDVGIKYPSWVSGIKLGFAVGRYTVEATYTYFEDQRFDESRTNQSKEAYETAKYKEHKGVGNYITADEFENKKVNTKEFGFKLNGLEVKTDGKLDGFVAEATETIDTVKTNDAVEDIDAEFADYTITRSNDNTVAFPVIRNGSVLPIYYEAKLPATSRAINNLVVGGVVFTLNFA